MLKKVTAGRPSVGRVERGITGLETAIVLIAFVVVASVFAFAVLSTGLLSSEKSKEAIIAGLEEMASSPSLRGSVVAHNSTTPTDQVRYITFQVGNASQAGEAVSLDGNDLIISYLDADQSAGDIGNSVTVPTSSTQAWNATWISGTGPLLNPGERVEVTVNISQLATPLGPSKEFTIEVRPAAGAVLNINRTTPAEITAVTDLR